MMGRANVLDNRLGWEMYQLQLDSARAIGDRHAELAALSGLGLVCGYLERRDEAAGYETAALTIARELGDQAAIIRLLARAAAGLSQEAPEEAAPQYEEAG